MQTETTTKPNETPVNDYIPSDDEVATPSGGRDVWRFAEGKIITGREDDGTLRDRPKVLGRLRRIGIFFGTAKDGTPYGQLETDIETAEGKTRVKAGITDKHGKVKPSVSLLCFAEGLLEIAKDELFVVTAISGTKKNAYGTYSTFVNLFHLDAATKRTTQVKRREFDKSKTMEERWEELAAELKTHPSYADRPAGEHDEDEGPTHFSELCREMKERGWPTPEEAPVDWMNLMAHAMDEKPRATLNDYTQDEWGEARLILKDCKALPGLLKPAYNRINKIAPDAKETPSTGGKIKADAFGAETDPFEKQ
jgi:hypothetical protein